MEVKGPHPVVSCRDTPLHSPEVTRPVVLVLSSRPLSGLFPSSVWRRSHPLSVYGPLCLSLSPKSLDGRGIGRRSGWGNATGTGG